MRRRSIQVLALSIAAACASCSKESSKDTPKRGADQASDPGQAKKPQTPPAGKAASAKLKAQVVNHYAEVVYATYSETLSTARTLQSSIDALLADPSEASLNAARAAWKAARVPYGQTEVFRFYGGPIDNDKTGPEGRLNAWPMDEGYVDYVKGHAQAGIINDVSKHPTLDLELVKSANEKGAEENVSTGYHAIEFLLWGQDMDPAGPGKRPATDYVAGVGNNDRRRTYLKLVTELLVSDLERLVKAWAPGAQNYRAEFVGKDVDVALTHILTGMGGLSGAELAGERMFVAWDGQEQEDEQSCFSDNTHVDIIENARGVQNVYLGRYGKVAGPGVKALVAEVNPELATRLEAALAASVDAAQKIPVPFDQAILGDDSADGRVKVKATIDLLRAQTTVIAQVAKTMGMNINLAE
ncbi:MAG: imelysin family protein [Bradymonadia bacterium]